MNDIVVNHNDLRITYSEIDNEWKCHELGLNAKSLSALRDKINDVDAKERKLGDGVKLIKLGGYKSNVELVMATLLDKPIEAHDRYVAVWVKHVNGGQREKLGFQVLVNDTPENRATLVESARLQKEGYEIVAKAEKMRQDIPRVTVEEIKALALEVKPS